MIGVPNVLPCLFILCLLNLCVLGEFLRGEEKAQDYVERSIQISRGDLPDIPQYTDEYEYEYEDEDEPFLTIDWGFGDDDNDEDDDEDDNDEDTDFHEESIENEKDEETETIEIEEEVKEIERELEKEDKDEDRSLNLWRKWIGRHETQMPRLRNVMDRALMGQMHVDPYFQVNWDLRTLFQAEDNWWEGPNVCERTEEEEEDLEVEDGAPSIIRHHMISSSTCDDTGTVYKCTTQLTLLNKRKKVSVIYECCHGYQREKDQKGCSKDVPLVSSLETVENLGATDFLEAIEGVSLTEFIQGGNYTIFAPKDSILQQFKPAQDSQPNVVIITPDLMEMAKDLEQTISSHIVEGFVRTSHVEDEQLLPTLSTGDSIRINIYERPRKLITANCQPIVLADNTALNGVVHVVDGSLHPVRDTIASIVSRNPDLSMFKTVIGQSGLLSMLKKDGQFTLLAPSNNAFNRLNPYVKEELLNGEQCLQDVIRNHLLPNVICSRILDEVDGPVLTINSLNKYLNVTHTAENKLFVEGAQVLDTDIMATNGVVHIIDEILIPEEALTVPEVIRKLEATTMLDYINQAGLSQEMTELNNFTLFLPSNEAFEEFEDELASEDLEDIIRHHTLSSPQLYDDLSEDNPELTGLSVKEYRTFPFGGRRQKTVQCAVVKKADIGTCGGVVHVIDRVLIPPKGDVMDVLAEHEEFSEFLGLLKKSGVAEELVKEGPFTIFAPTNQAVASLEDDAMKYLTDNPDKLINFLKHHIVQDIVCCSGVFDEVLLSRTKSTLDGSVVMTQNRFGKINVNHIPIKKCDTTTTNGVIHAIDQVIPEALQRYVNQFLHHQRSKFTDLNDEFEQWLDNLMDHVFGRKNEEVAIGSIEYRELPHGFSAVRRMSTPVHNQRIPSRRAHGQKHDQQRLRRITDLMMDHHSRRQLDGTMNHHMVNPEHKSAIRRMRQHHVNSRGHEHLAPPSRRKHQGHARRMGNHRRQWKTVQP